MELVTRIIRNRLAAFGAVMLLLILIVSLLTPVFGLTNPNVIDTSKLEGQDKIVFGATVLLHDEEKDKEIEYKIVGHEESDNRHGKISYKSPLGKALIGKEEGDTIVVKAPKGDLDYEILEVKYE